jgi:hypothetical protein
MTPHTNSDLVHSTLRALQMPGDALYKGAILAAALLLLLTAVV